MKLCTLKTSAEFKRVRGGVRCSTNAFLLEGKARLAHPSGAGLSPRFGFTVTKKLGGAVVRNRIRRRLKAAVRALDAGAAEPGHDYVIVARGAALDLPFAALAADLARAVRRASGAPRAGKPPGGRAALPAGDRGGAGEHSVRASRTRADQKAGGKPGPPSDNS